MHEHHAGIESEQQRPCLPCARGQRLDRLLKHLHQLEHMSAQQTGSQTLAAIAAMYEEQTAILQEWECKSDPEGGLKNLLQAISNMTRWQAAALMAVLS